MASLTKAKMAESLFNELGLNKREARELVDFFFEDLRVSLANGEQVKLSGFGNFDLLGTRTSGPGATRTPARKFPLRRGGWLPSVLARS